MRCVAGLIGGSFFNGPGGVFLSDVDLVLFFFLRASEAEGGGATVVVGQWENEAMYDINTSLQRCLQEL